MEVVLVFSYMLEDRPDVQFAVRNLATAMKNPTKKKYQELEHCALYLKKTSNYAMCYSCALAGRNFSPQKQQERSS